MWYNVNVSERETYKPCPTKRRENLVGKKTKEVDTMKKMSYVSAIDVVLAGGEMTDEVKERLEALKASLEKRNASNAGKPTKAQVANLALAEKVAEAMTVGVDYTIADIKALVPELADANPQKVCPLMKKLGNRIMTDKVKGKAVYRLAEGVE